MEELKYWIDVLITPFTIVAGILIAGYKGYFNKKLENVATKEDIEEITLKIENVKLSIDVLKHNQLSFQTLRREAIVRYNEALNEWSAQVFLATLENYEYSVMVDKFKQHVFECGKADSTLKLFFDEYGEFDELLNRIVVKLRAIQTAYLNELLIYNSTVTGIERRAEIRSGYIKYREQQYDETYILFHQLTERFKAIFKKEYGA